MPPYCRRLIPVNSGGRAAIYPRQFRSEIDGVLTPEVRAVGRGFIPGNHDAIVDGVLTPEVRVVGRGFIPGNHDAIVDGVLTPEVRVVGRGFIPGNHDAIVDGVSTHEVRAVGRGFIPGNHDALVDGVLTPEVRAVGRGFIPGNSEAKSTGQTGGHDTYSRWGEPGYRRDVPRSSTFPLPSLKQKTGNQKLHQLIPYLSFGSISRGRDSAIAE